MEQWMKESKTDPEIRRAICKTVAWWKTDGSDYHSWNPDIEAALEEQTDIGWWNFAMGIHLTKWQEIQKRYYQRIGSRRSPKRWASMFVRKMWDTAWDQWQHWCHVLHQPSEEERRDPELLNQQVQEEYSRGAPPNCPAHYRRHYATDLDSILQMTPNDKHKWLTFANDLRSALMEQTQQDPSIQQQRRAMRAFLNLPTP